MWGVQDLNEVYVDTPIIFCGPLVHTGQPEALGRSQKHGIPKLTGHLRTSFLWWHVGTWELFVAVSQITDNVLADGNHEAEHLRAQCPQDLCKRMKVVFSWEGDSEQVGPQWRSFWALMGSGAQGVVYLTEAQHHSDAWDVSWVLGCLGYELGSKWDLCLLSHTRIFY